MNRGSRSTNTTTIDLVEVFGVIWHWIWLILLVALAMGTAAYGFSKFALPEEYQSTTKIYVLDKSGAGGSNSQTTYSDLQVGIQLTKDYVELIKSRTVLEAVLKDNQLDGVYTYEKFADMVDVETPTDTRIVTITVTNTGNVVGPMISNKNPLLERALILDQGERWLLSPTFVDNEHFIMRPAVKVGVQPGSFTFCTPLFAPLLAVTPYDSLEDAVDLINSLGYSLASGLQSLDEEEQRYWKNNICAGNLYINRTTTGAVVGRQPFGSLKTYENYEPKTGGPNFLPHLMTITDKAGSRADYKTSYAEWYEREFRHARNLHPEIRGEQNIFRYRPLPIGVVMRLCGDENWEHVQMVMQAAQTVGTPLVISADEHNPFVKQLQACLPRQGVELRIETLPVFLNTMPNFDRIRSLTPHTPEDILKVADVNNKFVDQTLPVSDGRVELLHFLAEQSIANEYHRYGSQIEVPPVE